MTLAIATKPKKPSLPKAAKGKAKSDTDAPAPPPADTVAGIEAELGKLRADLAKVENDYRMDWQKRDKKEADLAAAIADGEGRLALARIKELPAAPVMAAALTFEERAIPIASIVRTGNHRDNEDPAQDEQLTRSIRTLGLQQRIAVRIIPQTGTTKPHLSVPPPPMQYELIWGSRRTKAATAAGWTEIPAKVYASTLTATDVEILRTVENFGRKELTPTERVIAVARIIDSIEQTLSPVADVIIRENGSEHAPETSPARKVFESLHIPWRMDVAKGTATEQSQSAAMVLFEAIQSAGGLHAYVGLQLGQTAKWVADHAFVARIGGEARALLSAGRIHLGHARELAKLGDKSAADGIAKQAAKREDGTGGETAEWAAKQVIEQLRSLKSTPWRLDIVIGRGDPACTGHACQTCPCNSRTEPDLYGGALAEEPEAGFCTNGGCFKRHQDLAEEGLKKFVKVVSAQKKKEKTLAITENNLAGVPSTNGLEFVKLSTAVRRAKKELEPASKPAGKAGGSGDHAPRQSPQEKAFEGYRNAVQSWASKAAPAISKALLAVPGRRGLFSLLVGIPAWNKTAISYANSLKEKAKAIARADQAAGSKELQRLITHLAEPTLAGFLELAKAADYRQIDDYLITTLPQPLIDGLGASIGLTDLPPRPKIEDFEIKAEPKATAKPAKKAGKGKRAPAPVVEDDESEDEKYEDDDRVERDGF